jgi:hypothetical protein
VTRAFVVVKNLFLIIVDGIAFIFAHLAIPLCLGFCSCLKGLCNLDFLLGYKEPCFLGDPQFVYDRYFFVLTTNQYKNLI